MDRYDCVHDDVIKWKHFPRYWPFVRGIHRSPVNSPHKGQWKGALIFSLICVWINGWVNNREAGDLRRYLAHYDVRVMSVWYVTNMQGKKLVIMIDNRCHHLIALCWNWGTFSGPVLMMNSHGTGHYAHIRDFITLFGQWLSTIMSTEIKVTNHWIYAAYEMDHAHDIQRKS